MSKSVHSDCHRAPDWPRQRFSRATRDQSFALSSSKPANETFCSSHCDNAESISVSRDNSFARLNREKFSMASRCFFQLLRLQLALARSSRPESDEAASVVACATPLSLQCPRRCRCRPLLLCILVGADVAPLHLLKQLESLC